MGCRGRGVLGRMGLVGLVVGALLFAPAITLGKPRAKPSVPADVGGGLLAGALAFAASEGATDAHDVQAIATSRTKVVLPDVGEALPGSAPVYVVAMRARFAHACSETLGEGLKSGCEGGSVLELVYGPNLELARTRRRQSYPDLKSLGVPVPLHPQRGIPASVRARLLTSARNAARDGRDKQQPSEVRAVLTTRAKVEEMFRETPGIETISEAQRAQAGEPIYFVSMSGHFEIHCLAARESRATKIVIENCLAPERYYSFMAFTADVTTGVDTGSTLSRHGEILSEYPDLASLGTPVLLEPSEHP